MIKYKKTQYSLLINVILILSIPFIIILYKFSTNPMPLAILIVALFILVFALFIFYKLTIIIDDTNITASFGFGLFKRRMLIKDIDLKTLEKVQPSMLTGIGIRFTTKGWLWNIKFGDAIYFKNKTRTKTFFVGTDDYNTIAKIVKQK